MKAFPRTPHLEDDIIQAFYEGIKHKPETTFGNVKADVLADKDPHFHRGNFCRVIRKSALARLIAILRRKNLRCYGASLADLMEPTMNDKPTRPYLTHASARPSDNVNIQTAGPRGPAFLQDVWLLEKLAHLRSRSHSGAAHARQRFRRLRHLHRHPRHHALHQGQDLFRRSASRRRCSRGSRRWRASAARPTPSVTFAVSRSSSTPKRATGTWWATTHRCSFSAIRLSFPDLNHAVKRDPCTGMRSADNNWDFWTLLPEALHQVTIVMSDRGIPRSFRHMHGFGSHTYSFINAKNERIWVKFHFKTRQGIQNLTDAEAEAWSARTAKATSATCSTSIERGEFPRWTLRPGDAGGGGEGVPFNPFDLTKVWPQADYPADRGRRFRAEPQSGEFLRRSRAGGVLAGQHRAGHRLFAGQDAAGASVLLWGRAALPARRQSQPDSCQRAEMPVPQLSPRRRDAH